MYPSILAPGNTQPYSSGPLEQSCLPHPQPHAPGHPSAFGAYQQQQDYPPMQQQQAMQHQQYPSGPQLVSEQHQLYPLSAPQQRHSSNGSCPYPALQQQPQQQMNGVSAYPSVAQQQQAPYPYPSQDLNNGLQQQQTLQRYNSNPYSQQQQQQLYPQQQQQELYPELRQQQQTVQRYNSNLDPQQQQQQQYPQQQQQQQQQEQLAYPMLHTQSCPLDQTQMQQQQQSLYPQLPRQQTAPQQSIYPSLDRQSTPQQQQQQQRREPLPPYPKLPPSLTFKASPDSVCNGYDVLVYINQATKLPGMDWWNGKADPYVIITTSAAGAEQQLEYRTQTIPASLNPKFDEFFELGNLPPGATLVVEVWDKDTFTEDDIIGRACWTFAPVEMLKCASAGGGMLGGDDSWGRIPVSIKLAHPVKKKQSKGTLEIEVCYRPSIQPGKPTMMGPVKFRQHLSPTAGALTGHWGDADTMSFSTYKLYLMHIESTFKGIRCPWNKKYDKAKTIFTNPVVLSMVCTQHNSLYATRMGATRCGVLENSQQFFELFKGGQRGGQRRYFTYTLLEDSFRCSETGAAFFSDMMSKHAMHAGGAEEVLFAGEFCIVPDGSAPGGHRLIIDNNSGTYAPDTEYLPLMKQLFKSNFKDMVVEVLPVGDPKLKMYQQQCPSRSGV